MTEIPSPLTKEELRDACEHMIEDLNTRYNGVDSAIRRSAEEEYNNVNTNLYSPEKIVMVDDSIHIIGAYLPHLVSFTRKNVDVLFHTDACHDAETAEELADLLEANYKEDVILMDSQLERPVYGEDIIRLLIRKRELAMKCVGFSSSSGNNDDLMRAGASAAVRKSQKPRITMPELVKAIENITKNA